MRAGACVDGATTISRGRGWFWLAMVCVDRRFRAACFRRGHYWIPGCIQSHGGRHARALGMVSHADVSVSRVARRPAGGSCGLFCANCLRGARSGVDAAPGLVLRRDPIFQRGRTHPRNDSGPHRGVGDVSASGARILFVTTSLDRVGVADGASAENRGNRIGLGRLRCEVSGNLIHV